MNTRISSIDALLKRDDAAAWIARHGRPAVLAALRDAAAQVRGTTGPADVQTDPDTRVAALAEASLRARAMPSLRRVVNATGVLLHTNLGRAPLSRTALEATAAIGEGYASLEYDLDAGERGRRDTHAVPLIAELTGAESALVVNNNAAATLLVLAAIAAGREVIVSRGELVEIGGGFRVPDVMAQSGAILREVGTTNRTRASDYAAAINDRTGLILRVHPSNFRMEGFTTRPAVAELSAVARQFSLPLFEDAGSGLLSAHARFPEEPDVRHSLASGADLVSFSGDKLLGGPQAGIVAGRRALVEHVARHPLMRAVRVDKLTYAALDATLRAHAAGRAETDIPFWRMLTTTPDAIETRARALATALPAPWMSDVLEGMSAIGGGSAPAVDVPTRLLAVTHPAYSADAVERGLRAAPTPVVARVQDGRVLLDLRTVDADEDRLVLAALQSLTARR